MSTPPGAPSFADAFRHPPFRRLWTGQVVSLFGDFIALFAVISLISFRWKGTAAQVTLVQIAYMLPLVIVGPVAGVFVDRWNVRTTMIASDLIRALLILTLVAAPGLAFVFVAFFAISTVSSFFIPAQSITLRAIMPPEALLAANALMQQAMQLVRIGAPLVSGALVASLGENSCFYLDAVSFVISAWMISTLPKPEGPHTGGSVRSVTQDLLYGLRFILTHPAISFVILSMASAMFVMGCFGPLIAVYVRDTLHAGPVVFGSISSMIGVGMIIGTFGLHKAARGRPNVGLVTAGLVGIGASVLLLGVFRFAATAAAGAFGMGFFVAFIVVPAQTLMQRETPKEVMGRVSATTMSLVFAAQVIGLMISGSLASAVGIQMLFVLSAAALLVSAVAGHWIRLRREPLPASN